MKIRNISFIALLSLFAATSCDRLEEVDTPQFEVKVDKEIYQIGDSIRFVFNGNPDIISFYSGELGHNYEYSNGRIAIPLYFINFETQSRDGTQTNQMKILVSKDFNGDYTIDGVHRATWTDITSRFTMAPPSNGSAYVNSGFGDFNDLLDADTDTTKIYFAVKQDVLNQNIYGRGNLNRLRYFTITSIYETLESKLYEHANLGWQLFSTPNKQPNRASIENTYTIMMRNSWWISPEDYFSRDTEDWAVSIQVPLPKNLNMGPDRAISIKGVNDISVNGYSYVFNNPGVYKVVFKAINANFNSYKEVLRELSITVTN